ncbi:hypothetical protein CPB83DRAFT_863802 [Crepidotus variabilis]|uniref:Uncharacterized protein n=1 Tax=Crepidotus variabilis TaxID=179855 RepID=A0A9P6JJ22_9AGAR|nr:hypothetical protein CPB83DRAFT_863802 [Crepidotus variabilis]
MPEFDLAVLLGTILLTLVDALQSFMTMASPPSSKMMFWESQTEKMEVDSDLECGSPTEENCLLPQLSSSLGSLNDQMAVQDRQSCEEIKESTCNEVGAFVDLQELRIQHREKMRKYGLPFIPRSSDTIIVKKPQTGKQLGSTTQGPESYGNDHWKWVLVAEAKKCLVSRYPRVHSSTSALPRPSSNPIFRLSAAIARRSHPKLLAASNAKTPSSCSVFKESSTQTPRVSPLLSPPQATIPRLKMHFQPHVGTSLRVR